MKTAFQKSYHNVWSIAYLRAKIGTPIDKQTIGRVNVET